MHRILHVLFAVLLIGCGLTLVAGCTDTGTNTPAPVASIAYIYQSDSATANAFKSFLDTNGHQADLIALNTLDAADLTKYKLLIVADDDTGWMWAGTDAQAQKIKASNLPVIAIGAGTAMYSNAVFGLDIAYSNALIGSGSTVSVAAPSYFTGITGAVLGATITVLNSNASVVVGPHTAAVTSIGIYPADPNHDCISLQGKYAMWGFKTVPNSMTSDGKRLFLNIIQAMMAV